MTRYPDPEEVERIRWLLEERFRDAPVDVRERAVRFQMGSVDEHRRNLVPLVGGHGAMPGQSLLDFGSGPGCSAVAIALDLDMYVTGVEVDERNRPFADTWIHAFDVSQKLDLHYLRNTKELPFDAATFDFVLASSSLEYIPGDRGPYLREMWRVLRPGGRLIVAGTSNAVWPREVHSKSWLVNWMPNLGPRIRSFMGEPVAERGITFGEIQHALGDPKFVRGEYDELAAFAARLGAKFGETPGRFLDASTGRGLEWLNEFSESHLGWPAEAFLPWLNVAFEKG